MTATAEAAALPIRVFQDILDILAGHPQLADLMRQHLLTPELLNLPQVVDHLAADLQRINEVLDQVLEVQQQHTQDIAELKAGQARLEAGQAKLEAGQARLENGQDTLFAKFLPLDAKKMIGTIAGIFNIRRPVWLDNTDLLNLVDEAGDAADSIPESELQSLIRSDLALRAVSKSDRQTRYVLIECSGSITRNDIRRARRNADHLARITAQETYALIIGKLPPENILRAAEADGVHCLQPSEKVARVV